MSFLRPLPAMCTGSGIGMSVVRGVGGGVGSVARPVGFKVAHLEKS